LLFNLYDGRDKSIKEGHRDEGDQLNKSTEIANQIKK
jgi:hypothetical protein